MLGIADFAWPCAGDGPSGELSAAAVAKVVLLPNLSAAERKRALQLEIRRWHPDKFEARWASRLVRAEAQEVLRGAMRVSQALTELLSQAAET